jgi:hypothetical protein
MSPFVFLIVLVLVLVAAGFAARQLLYRSRTLSEWYYFSRQPWVRWVAGGVAGLVVLLVVMVARH